MIEAGHLRLGPGIDPADITYMQFDLPPNPELPTRLAGAGQLHLPACTLSARTRERLADTFTTARLVAAMMQPVTAAEARQAPEIIYRHCGRRRCAECDQLFLGIYPTRAQQRAANALTPAQRRERRAARRQRLRRLWPFGSTKPARWR